MTRPPPSAATLLKIMQSILPSPQHLQATAQDASDQALRDSLAAALHQSPRSSGPQSMDQRPSSSASPHDHNIDPAIAGSGQHGTTSNDSGDENVDGSGKKGGKRELSTSKRAAQNRAAQRAFRQRKEGYIKKLEEQVRDLHALEESYKAIQAENYQLRDYIINLQSRLIESQGEFPQPPSNINLPHPQGDTSRSGETYQSLPQSSPTIPAPAVSQLQTQASAAQAVVNLGSGKHHHEEAAYLSANGISSPKRLKSERGLPAAAPAQPVETRVSSGGV